MKGRFPTVIIVLLLLVGLPLSSYLYLRKGMDFRLDAIEALQVKAHLPVSANISGDGIKILYTVKAPSQHLIDSIKLHFGARPDLHFLPIGMSSTTLEDSLVKVNNASLISPSTAEQVIYLVDKEGGIRRSYPVNLDALAQLTQHIAFLLPPEPEKDFDFKRTSEK